MKLALKYAAGLIAVYLGVYYSTGAGTLITDAAAGSTNIVKAFQGR